MVTLLPETVFIISETCVLITKCCSIQIMYDHPPPYFCEIVIKYKLKRQIRSSGKCMYVVLKISSKGYGARSFLYASATLSNELCDDRT